MNQRRQVASVARVDRHLECVDREIAAQPSGTLPADDYSTEHVNDKGHVDPSTVRLHVGQVRDPESVRRGRDEMSIDEVTWSVLVLVADCRDPERTTAPHTAESLVLHEPTNGAVGDSNPFTVELLPNLLGAVGAVVVGLVPAQYFGLQGRVVQLTWRYWTRQGGVVRGRGELQCSADRLDPPSSLAGVDVANYLRV
jgi:hypothetical protein